MVFIDKNTLRNIRNIYKHGLGVKLISMEDPYTELKRGDCGIIDFIDDGGGIHIAWDNGSSLAAIYGVDEIEIVGNQ